MLNGKNMDEIISTCDKDGNNPIDYNEFKPAFCHDMFKIIPGIVLILIVNENKIRIVSDIKKYS